MENMELYNKLRTVPQEAKKPITAGRLKGFTDINPMWRIKALTETFGPCGIGWWYVVTDKRMEGSGDEIRAFVDIELYYVIDGQTSKPIVGMGGSSFLTKERNGAYTSDECYKMALTDAISVAAKALGVGADVYFDRDRDKYTPTEQDPRQPQQAPQNAPQQHGGQGAPNTPPPQQNAPQRPPQQQYEPREDKDGYYICQDCGQIISAANGMSPKEVAIMAMKNYNGTQLCFNCGQKRWQRGQR